MSGIVGSGSIGDSTAAGEPMSESQIQLRIPVESRFVAVARVTAASLAAELDFTVDGIEDLRTGANEVVALLLEAAEDHGATEIVLDFAVGEDSLEITGTVAGAGAESMRPSPAVSDAAGAGVLDTLTERVLAAVVDEFEVSATSCRIVKQRA